MAEEGNACKAAALAALHMKLRVAVGLLEIALSVKDDMSSLTCRQRRGLKRLHEGHYLRPAPGDGRE